MQTHEIRRRFLDHFVRAGHTEVPSASLILADYWDMGVPGPGGPCSESCYDRGPEHGRDYGPVADDDRHLEIWNLVFMQDIRGELSPKLGHPPVGTLPKKNIDTGIGVERVALLLQGVDNVYETDLLRRIVRSARLLGAKKPVIGEFMRVVMHLLGNTNGKVPFVVALGKGAQDLGFRAGDLVGSFGPSIAGRGGGKPVMAQGSGSDPASIAAGLAAVRTRVAELAG